MTNESLASKYPTVNCDFALPRLRFNGSLVFTSQSVRYLLGMVPSRARYWASKIVNEIGGGVFTIYGDDLEYFKASNSAWIDPKRRFSSITLWVPKAVILAAERVDTQRSKIFLICYRDELEKASVREKDPGASSAYRNDLRSRELTEQQAAEEHKYQLKNRPIFVWYQGEKVVTNETFCFLLGIKKRYVSDLASRFGGTFIPRGSNYKNFKEENDGNLLVNKSAKQVRLWELDTVLAIAEKMPKTLHVRLFFEILGDTFKEEIEANKHREYKPAWMIDF